MNHELMRYLDRYDLDEEEYESLSEWVNDGHSVYSNPDEEYDDYGDELHFMKWYWKKKDPHPMWERKKTMTEAMKPVRTMPDNKQKIERLMWARQILCKEIVMYRRFLAAHKQVEAFQQYRDLIVNDR